MVFGGGLGMYWVGLGLNVGMGWVALGSVVGVAGEC